MASIQQSLLFILLAVCIPGLSAQSDTIEVAKVAVKVGAKATEELYYAFAAGDRILFDFSELDGDPVSEFTVSEYPDQLRFQEVNTARVEGGQIKVTRTGVFLFRFSNRALLKGRTCGIHIRRIPAGSAQRQFNTAVQWVERYDTTVVDRGKDQKLETKLVEKRRRVQTKTDTLVLSLVDRVERVHSRSNFSAEATSVVAVELPLNTAEPNAANPYLTSEVVSWSYWLGVGEEAEKEFQNGNQLAQLAKTAMGAVEAVGMLTGGYGALISLAIEGVSYFTMPTKGDNVKFRILAGEKLLEEGDGPAAFARRLQPLQGTISFELTNDNIFESVDVNLRVVVVIVRRHYQEEIYHEEEATAVVERVVKLVRVPVVRE